MKICNLLFTICTVLIITSCATTSFYQVYSVQPVDESITKNSNLFFEDENCIISYNFWENGGNIGFNMYNKTDNNIYIKLNKSFFILNGFSYNYFQNRTFTTSEINTVSFSNSSATSTAIAEINIYDDLQTNTVISSNSIGISPSVEYTVSKKEDSIICIPSKTSKRISEYSINNHLIRNCDLFLYPKIKEINTKSYTVKESPIVFSNRITYETNGNLKLVVNKFYVSEITNYPESEFIESKKNEFCDQESFYTYDYYKFYDITKFYLKYNRGKELWNH